MSHAPHLCWHCSYTILPDEAEKKVEGLPRVNLRYAHATEEGCHKAINRTPYPETYGRYPEDDAIRLWDGS